MRWGSEGGEGVDVAYPLAASPMERLVAEWLAERARFIGSLIGLTDEQFNAETAPGQWTYRIGTEALATVVMP